MKRTIVKHFRRRHGFKGGEPNVKEFYTRLEPRECNLGLDEDVMTSIFGPPKKPANELLIGDYVTFTNFDQGNKDQERQAESSQDMDDDDDEDDEQNDGKSDSEDTRDSEKDNNRNSGSDAEHDIKTHIVKIETKDYSDQGENDLEPTDFVSVKIEPMDHDDMDEN